MMNRLLVAATIVAVVTLVLAGPAIHYAPAENLEHVDVALIDSARQEIDLAAYVLTDWPVIQALTRAADRGVKVRIYLDGTPASGTRLEAVPGARRNAWRRSPHQGREPIADAPKIVPGGWPSAPHGRRELLGIRGKAAG